MISSLQISKIKINFCIHVFFAGIILIAVTMITKKMEKQLLSFLVYKAIYL